MGRAGLYADGNPMNGPHGIFDDVLFALLLAVPIIEWKWTWPRYLARLKTGVAGVRRGVLPLVDRRRVDRGGMPGGLLGGAGTQVERADAGWDGDAA